MCERVCEGARRALRTGGPNLNFESSCEQALHLWCTKFGGWGGNLFVGQGDSAPGWTHRRCGHESGQVHEVVFHSQAKDTRSVLSRDSDVVRRSANQRGSLAVR